MQQPLRPENVSAIIVTRGNVDLQPVLATLPYDDVVIWDNSKRPEDLKIYGRYAAIEEAKHDVVYFQDDDIIFTRHAELLAAYEPGLIVANMGARWVLDCDYYDMVLLGAGSICDRGLPGPALDLYLAEYPLDDEFMLQTDFIVGTLVPGKKIDLGFEAREFADDDDRLYRQPGQTATKYAVRAKAREIRARTSPTGRASICLTMICKDEAESIADCIKSALPLIDRWAIVDTGSTDGTQEIVRDALSGLPGTLYESEWQGFGPSRTEALQRGRETGADYLLMLDADHRLHVDGDLPELTKDSYNVRVRGPMEWKLPLLMRALHPWEFKGAAHCYLTSGAVPATSGEIPLSIEPGPAPTAEKIAGDLPLLQREVAAHPDDRRSVFYLAQTYRDMGRNAEAAATYLRRVRMGGWDQEVFWSRYQEGLIRSWSDWERAVPILLDSWAYRPTRAEPLYVLARGYHGREEVFLADHFARLGIGMPLPTDNLFVLNWMYDRDVWEPFLLPEPARPNSDLTRRAAV